jgi:tRNA-modifying protein YgfZ
MIIHPMNHTLTGIATQPHLGLIRVAGEDAASFLQGQLTQDFALLDLTEARLAGFCSAKGRMQASFIGFKRSPTEILLVCSRDLLAQTLKRLSMFVMRAKVKLSDATEEFSLLGLAGVAINNIAGNTNPPWTKADMGTQTIVHLYPADGTPRAFWIAPVGESLPVGETLSTEAWQWGEVRSGIATVTLPIFEAFVPQMLNYESVGGVNFKKGCYPGQEVVARSQFRGTLKRRAYIVHCSTVLSAGDEVFDSAEPDQPCGIVAQAAPAPQGGFDAIVSMQTSAVDGRGLRLGQADGPVLELLPLPYELLADI